MCSLKPSTYSSRRTVAFTVTELMVAVSILGIIVVALYSVFNQTQKAMRSNESQVDVGERGRAVMEMISRDLEQAIAAKVSGETNMFGGIGYPAWPPQVQGPMDKVQEITPRTNVLHQLFFLTRQTNNWVATGYKIAGSNAMDGVGALYRYSTNLIGSRPTSNQLSSNFFISLPTQTNTYGFTNSHLIADGVVHFRLTAYDPAGQRLGYDTTNVYPAYRVKREKSTGFPINNTNNIANPTVILEQALPGSDTETRFAFLSNALPAYVDVELGVLEPETLKLYQAIATDGAPGAGRKFLTNRITKVHLFRRRVPIHTAVQ